MCSLVCPGVLGQPRGAGKRGELPGSVQVHRVSWVAHSPPFCAGPVLQTPTLPQEQCTQFAYVWLLNQCQRAMRDAQCKGYLYVWGARGSTTVTSSTLK